MYLQFSEHLGGWQGKGSGARRAPACSSASPKAGLLYGLYTLDLEEDLSRAELHGGG